MAVSPRPHKNLRIDGLHSVFEHGRNDPAVLAELTHELSFRDSSAASALKEQIDQRIALLDTTSRRDGNKPTLQSASRPQVHDTDHTGASPSSQAATADVRNGQVDRLRSALDRVRRKLLDLSANNRLLNYRFTARSLRVVEEVPDQLFQQLVEGRELIIEPLPEPRRDEMITPDQDTDPTLFSADETTPASTWGGHSKRLAKRFRRSQDEIVFSKKWQDCWRSFTASTRRARTDVDTPSGLN